MAEGGLRKPEVLSFEGNVAENWRKFLHEYEIFVLAGYPAANERVQAALLLNLAGPEAIERERTFTYLPVRPDPNNPAQNLPAESRDDPECLKRKFGEICNPITNVITEQFLFGSRHQQPGESFQTFLSALKILVSTCEFGDLTNVMLRSQIVLGIANKDLQKKLLKDTKLTLESAIHKCQIEELGEKNAKTIQSGGTSSTDVHAVNHKPHKKQYAPQKQWPPQKQWIPQKKLPAKPQQKVQYQECGNCGREHPPNACPAFKKQCNKCKKWNHFGYMCRSPPQPQARRQWSQKPKRQPAIHEVEYECDYDCDYDYNEQYTEEQDYGFQIESIEVHSCNESMSKDEIYTKLVTKEGYETDIKIDSGAKCNTLSLSSLRQMQALHYLDTSKTARLTGFFGEAITTVGKAVVPCYIAGQNVTLDFQVADHSKVKNLLGLKDSLKLNLIQLGPDVLEVTADTIDHGIPQHIRDKYPVLFQEGIGKLPVQYRITLDQNVPPVIRSARTIAVRYQEKAKATLDDMVMQSIIAPVTRPTDRVSAMVLAAKRNTDDIRVCIDPGDLNKAIKRPHYPLRTIEQVVAKLAGAKFFTVLDAKQAFYHIPLDEESSYHTTFATPYGRYRYLRLPMGISPASEVYQQAIEHLMDGYPCAIIMDDILVWGKTEQEHEANVHRVMQRLSEINLRLSVNKCKYKMTSVPYVGHILTDKGLQVDPVKVEAISKMPSPENTQDLLRFMGMVKYICKFVPNLSEKSGVLNQLLKKDVLWTWEAHHQKAYDHIKDCIVNAAKLAYYDPQREVTLTCDASSHGLGAACLQEGRPVAYASRALKPAEKNYPQIVKELLAVVFACHKFHDFVYGREFKIETDHQPLVTIVKKPLASASAKQQDLLLKLQRYSFELMYKKGKELYLADTLSRAHIGNDDIKNTRDDLENYEVLNVLPLSNRRFDELVQETQNDIVLQELAKTVLVGWPQHQRTLKPELQAYYPFRDEITTSNGILLKGQKIIVPETLRDEYAKQVHQGHINVEATKRRARDIIYWPHMAQHLENMVGKCQVCLSMKRHLQKEPLLPYPVPNRPWSVVGTDLFEWNSTTYLLTIDSYSGWFEINSLRDTSAKTIITKLKSHFARFGIPNLVISDSGSQYTSREFQTFAQEWNFQHTTSSPEFHSSNGLAEQGVQSAKRLLEKCKRDGSDVYLSLLNWRNIPRDNVLGSPAQRNMSRRTRTLIPVHETLLKPSVTDSETVQYRLSEKRQEQKVQHDKGSRLLPSLQVGDPVLIQAKKGFHKPGVVTSIPNVPRSYIVRTNQGEYRRNRRHILKVPTPTTPAKPMTQPTIPVTPPRTPNVVRAPVLNASTPKSPDQQQPQQSPTSVQVQSPQRTLPRTSQNEHSHSSPQKTVQANIAEGQSVKTPPVKKSRCGRSINLPERYKD